MRRRIIQLLAMEEPEINPGDFPPHYGPPPSYEQAVSGYFGEIVEVGAGGLEAGSSIGFTAGAIPTDHPLSTTMQVEDGPEEGGEIIPVTTGSHQSAGAAETATGATDSIGPSPFNPSNHPYLSHSVTYMASETGEGGEVRMLMVPDTHRDNRGGGTQQDLVTDQHMPSSPLAIERRRPRRGRRECNVSGAILRATIIFSAFFLGFTIGVIVCALAQKERSNNSTSSAQP
ncbi:hypothetical protein [Candidatus Ichthyocystis hellenicum]|uniref:hypothetical protein n=1 Tax=Candidatus Ichthyocystis hellenicum TaxID=1561003 RepID=UPI000B827733|nr:hypothetical protein [Candidatus Ichthyocystis hellenicum]